MPPLRFLLAGTLLSISFVSADAMAQQAIVSMPSADVTPAGKAFVMHETQMRPWGPKAYWNTTHFFTTGIGIHSELAVTLFNVGVPATGNMTVATGFKTALPIAAAALPTLEFKLTFGAMLLVSLNARGLGHWLYAHASMRVPVARTRISVGFSHGGPQLFEVAAGSFIASIEQPLGTDKLNLVAEWFSGEHDLGNLIAGLTFHPDHTWIFVAGFKFPTSGPRFGAYKEAIVLEVGAFF